MFWTCGENISVPCGYRWVSIVEVCGTRVRGRPTLGWMDNLKVALGSSLTLKKLCQIVYQRCVI